MSMDYDQLNWEQQSFNRVLQRQVDNQVCAYEEELEFRQGFKLVRRRLKTSIPIYYASFDSLNHVGMCYTFGSKRVHPKDLAFDHLFHSDLNISNGYHFKGKTLKALNEPLYYVSLHFDKSYLNQLNEKQPLPSWLFDLSKDSAIQKIDHISAPAELRHLAWKICCLPKIINLSDILRIEAHALEWLAIVLDMANQTACSTTANYSRLNNDRKKNVDEVCDIIKAEFSQPLTITELAQRTGTNECYLKQYFKQHTGLTIHHYLTQYRLTHARELLRNQPNVSITEVAGICGYQASHFSHLFRKTYGMSPMQYRKGEY